MIYLPKKGLILPGDEDFTPPGVCSLMPHRGMMGAAGAGAPAYVVPFSADFERGDGDEMNWTPGAGATSDKITTLSTWYKRESTGTQQMLFTGPTANFSYFHTDNKISYDHTSGGLSLRTTATFTDTASWHHLLLRIDTTQGTAADRLRLYHDGTKITTFDTASYPALNETHQDLLVNGDTQKIGRFGAVSAYDGLLAEMAITDGQSYGPESFRDASTGAPLDLSGLTFGTNGFWQDNTTLGNDISGNGNHYTNATAVQSSDVPS